MTALTQHPIFDAVLTEPDAPTLPWWMAEKEPEPDWAFRRSGAFPVLQDKALIEEEKPDVR